MAETFAGFSAIQQRASQQAERQRAEARARTQRSTTPSRDKKTTTDPYKDLSQYGKLYGTSVQERPDGSKVYYKDNKIVAEYNAQGKRVVRVGVSTKTPSSSGVIKRITPEVMVQQRYKEALDKYNKELSRLQAQRQEEVRKAAFQKAVFSRSYQGTSANYLMQKAALEKLKGPYSDEYKQRALKELDLRLASELNTIKNLNKRLTQVNAAKNLTPKELKQLQKIQNKVSRVEAERTKLSKTQEETVKKITGRSIIRGESYLARAARELPAQAFSTFYNLAPALYKTGLEVDAFFAMLTASPKVIEKSKFRQGAVDNFKKTGKAILEAYDPRNPANLFNIILTATAIAGMGYAKANKAAFNKQLSQAKITKGKVTVYGPRSKTPTYLVKGELRLPKIKFLGREIPARNVPFRTVQKLTRSSYNSQAFKVQGATKYLLNKTKLSLKGLKLKKAYINAEKNVLFKGKGTAKPIGKGKQYLVKQKVSLKSGLRRASEKSRSVVAKKKITKLSTKQQQSVLTKIKKVQSTDKVVRLKFKSEYAQLSAKSVNQVVVDSLRGIVKNLKRSVSKKSLQVAKANIKSLKTFLKDYYKARGRMITDKKGTLYLTREGDVAIKPQPPRDFSKIDSLLKRVEELEKARFKPIAKKPRVSLRSKGVAKPKARYTQQMSYRIKAFDPSLVFKGFQLIGKPLVFNKFLPINLMITSEGVKPLGLTEVPSLPKIIGGVEAPTKPTIKLLGTTGSEPITKPDTGAEPQPTTPEEVVNILSTTPFILNRFFPFSGGLPIPGISGAGRIYSVPLDQYVEAERYNYSADLYSKIYGLRASKNDRDNLLRAGRVFSGLEIRKII